MNEEEWLACTDPTPMLDFPRGKVSDRKLRLFVCACCRRVWHKLFDKQTRRAVEVAERLADGQADPAEVAAARTEMDELLRRKEQEWGEEAQLSEAALLYSHVDRLPRMLAQSALEEGVTTQWTGLAADFKADRLADNRPLVETLHDIFGNPFHSMTISPTILAWNDAVVVRLAQTAYEERHLPTGTLDNSRLAVLADALEEAGCTDADILGHLRGPGPHVRGCWPVDLLLGKS